MRIGIIGAGQLGRMMALSGIPLGLEFTMYDRSAEVPGAAVAKIVTGAFDDRKKLERFARSVDVVTFDWENVPIASARAIAKIRPVWPPPRALEVAQDRLFEKRLFQRLGMRIAPFAPVDSEADLASAIATLGTPGLLKTRRLGYDGKGQAPVRRARDAGDAWERLRGPAARFGQQRIYASHNSIMFSRTSCYCFVRPKKTFLEVCVFLPRGLKHPKVRRADRT